ncbi:MAG: methylenetetrahydrofolate reductase [NAD(P)H] [Candidatus Pelagibacter sp. TMED273]|nr:MAG: methylenetetrahydrofolate reductase [NAD(P)H] [Candidatus Pelagibacter sp. TMED273]|tara:strand:+ start:168 stop:1100 length:933 start_codon:yes stop_codon:yes gene_type:complete
MKVTDHINKSNDTQFSYEIIPPLRGKGIKIVLDMVESLQKFNPPFIDVTSHASTVSLNKDGKKIKKKKRPGTISICGIIQNRFNIDTVAHLGCNGFTKEETEDALIELGFLGIENILAISGDGNPKEVLNDGKTINANSLDLVHQINDLKDGKYLTDISNSSPIEMCTGIGVYPENHFHSNNFEQEISLIKRKIEAGADYAVTQMFFDNKKYFDFVDKCRAQGITIPIIPGIKILDKPRQVESLERIFHINLPEELKNEARENIEHIDEIGTKWAINQSEELINAGVPVIHYYLMNDTSCMLDILNYLHK